MRRTRSDCTVGTFEKKHGLPPGTIRNKDGRDTRSDKWIGTIRKEKSARKQISTVREGLNNLHTNCWVSKQLLKQEGEQYRVKTKSLDVQID